jgi:glycerol-3-phosphate acyltransferase PlsY
MTMGAVALAAFLGHLFPVYFGFKGGKGVATAAGILVAVDWRVGITVLAVWIVVALVSRFSSLAAVVAAIGAPALTYGFLGWVPQVWAALAMALLLLWRHRGNIERLLKGTESRIRLKRGA